MPRKVLYIEDDEGVRTLVKRSLEREGIAVVTAPDGASGLAALEREPDIDIVAVDLVMPDMDGLEVTRRVNEIPNHPPVIVVTGSEDSRTAVTALRAGAFDYVVKDIDGDFIFLLKSSMHTAADAMRTRRAKEAAEAEVRAARDRFEALAAERALLMREVNHRVGNSLQLIASLLTLQSNAAGAADVKQALASANGRVLAVAQVHRRLYTSEDVQSVDVDQYLTALVEDLRRSSMTAEWSQVNLRCDPIQIEPDRAVALGVIVNELITNAVKYAYPGAKGPVRAGLQRKGGNHAVLSVEDDGIGVQSGGKTKSRGLGQSIVKAMAEKLKGEIDIDGSGRGTKVTVSFPIADDTRSRRT